MDSPAPVCPSCGLTHCSSQSQEGTHCRPPTERRSGAQDRRQTERRAFPRPEGRRINLGRREEDPLG